MVATKDYYETLSELREATETGNLSTVQQLLPLLQPSRMNMKRHTDPVVSHRENLRTLLNNAALYGHISLVEHFLSIGAPLEGWMGRYCIEFSKSDPTEVLTAYLQHGWDINADDESGTALTGALRIDNLDLVTFLLDHGADINQPSATSTDAFCVVQDFTHATIPRKPIEWAAGYHSLESVQLLVSRGALPHESNALHVASGSTIGYRVPILQYLLEQPGVAPMINEVEFSGHWDREFMEKWGDVRPFGTPLHYAEERAVEENVAFLEANGADKERKDPLTAKTPAEWKGMSKIWRRATAIKNWEVKNRKPKEKS
ncbi:MAG: hypothetical protein Q9227_008522 [Pyrenula ochraceoflavens]